MNQPSPYQSPTATGRSSALPSLLTTQTKWPFAPCCTARCGTRIAFGRIAPCSRVRTYWFGRSTPFGLSTEARIRKVPVCELYDGSAKVILPLYGNSVPSTSSISTVELVVRRAAGAGPFCTCAADALHLVLGEAEVDPHRRQHRHRRQLAVLRVDVGAVGDGGEAADAVDRRGDRRVGEVELGRVELRLRLRDRGGGLLVLALRVVQVLLRQRVLLRRAAWCARGWPRATSSAAWLRCSAAAAPSTCAWNGFGSIRNSTWPGLDHRAFGVDALVEEAGDARRDVDRLRALRLRDEHRA